MKIKRINHIPGISLLILLYGGAIIPGEVLTFPKPVYSISGIYNNINTDCHDCEKNSRDENKVTEPGALCAFTYIIYFLWFSVIVISVAVTFVMDLSTGFTQHFTKDFINWAKETTNSLKNFFASMGCK